MSRNASAVWRITRALVAALDERLGMPVDSYVNGTQTWLTDLDPDTTLEWRLHPVAGYRTPGSLSHYDVWEQVVGALANGAPPTALDLGGERRALDSLWDGLETFVAIGDDVEPAVLARAVGAALPVPPDAVGLVDHGRIGTAWEQSGGKRSLVEMLLTELQADAGSA
jgi:hypothetical protein